MRNILIALLLSTSAYAQYIEPIDSVPLTPPIGTPPPITLYVPDFLSPNGDGINDTFNLNTEPEDRVELKVYSRWGNLVYSSDDYQNDYSPTELADGVYAFWIRVNVGTRYEDFQEMVTIIR